MSSRARAAFVLVLLLGVATGIFAFGAHSGAPSDAPAEVASSSTLSLEVNRTARTLTVMEHGEATRVYDVTVGKPGHVTPTGSFRISWMEWNPSWTPPDSPWARGKRPVGPGPDNPMGRVKMFFRAPAYYIHGTNAEQELGRAASHGCVRLRNEDVIDLAQLVMEHGGADRPESWFRRVLNRMRDTQQVRLSAPVPLVIRD